MFENIGNKIKSVAKAICIISSIFIIAISVVLSLAGCGGEKIPEPTPTPTPAITAEPTPTPIPTPTPEPTPTPKPNYSWQKYTFTETTPDGYQIEKYYAFIDQWISSRDEERIQRICNELNINNMPSAQNMGLKVNETDPQLYYVFGKASCANVTQGWNIDEGNAKSISYEVGIELPPDAENADTNKMSYSIILHGFYSDSVSTAHTYGNYGYFQRDDHAYSSALGISLNKNRSGTLPFVIAVYSQTNPNYPDGDDWYKALSVTVRDKMNYVGSSRYEPEFKFTPIP